MWVRVSNVLFMRSLYRVFYALRCERNLGCEFSMHGSRFMWVHMLRSPEGGCRFRGCALKPGVQVTPRRTSTNIRRYATRCRGFSRTYFLSTGLGLL